MKWFFNRCKPDLMKIAIVMQRKSGNKDYLIKIKEVPEYENAYLTRDDAIRELSEDFELITITPQII